MVKYILTVTCTRERTYNMTRFYLIEGPDGAGKSTLAEDLKKEHEAGGESVYIWHNSAIETTAREEYLEPLLEYISEGGETEYDVVIIDRLHLSELVYAQVLRDGETSLDEDLAIEIDEALDKLNTVRIWMDTPLITCIERCRERGEDFVTEEQIGMIHALYDWRLSGDLRWARSSMLS